MFGSKLTQTVATFSMRLYITPPPATIDFDAPDVQNPRRLSRRGSVVQRPDFVLLSLADRASRDFVLPARAEFTSVFTTCRNSRAKVRFTTARNSRAKVRFTTVQFGKNRTKKFSEPKTVPKSSPSQKPYQKVLRAKNRTKKFSEPKTVPKSSRPSTCQR